MSAPGSCCPQPWNAVGSGLVEVRPLEGSVSEKGQLRSHFFTSPLTFLFPDHCLLGQLGIYLATGNNWPSGFQQDNGYSSPSDELPDSGGSYFPEPTTSAYVGESGLPA